MAAQERRIGRKDITGTGGAGHGADRSRVSTVSTFAENPSGAAPGAPREPETAKAART